MSTPSLTVPQSASQQSAISAPPICANLRENLSSPACRSLRRQIQAIRIKRLGWSDYVFHYIMQGLGYGTSLRSLSESQLTDLYTTLKGYRKHGKSVEFNYDRQGNYMFHLQKQAGWDDRTMMAYLTITYKKTHWNLLTGSERHQLLTILKSIVTSEPEAPASAHPLEPAAPASAHNHPEPKAPASAQPHPEPEAPASAPQPSNLPTPQGDNS